MILEVRAVPPFYKNGFVVGCERTREAVVIDPGDEADELLGGRSRSRRARSAHPADPRAHRPHHRRRHGAKRALESPVYLHQDDLFLYEHGSSRGDVRIRGPAAAAGRRVLRPEADLFRRLRGPRPPHAGPLSRRGVPAGRRERRARARTCSSATRCLPDRSAAPTCRAAITSPDAVDHRVLFPLGDASIVHPGHGADTTIGRERTTNPFVRRVPRQEHKDELDTKDTKVTKLARNVRRVRRAARRAACGGAPIPNKPGFARVGLVGYGYASPHVGRLRRPTRRTALCDLRVLCGFDRLVLLAATP